MDHMITEATATGEEIAHIVNGLEEALEGTPRGHAIIALLSLTLIVMNPMITPDELQDAVKDTSQFICLLLNNVGIPEVELSKTLPN